jgi:hypothetical protein
MSSRKKGICKKLSSKVTSQKYNPIPFLDRPLTSILRFMQETRRIQMVDKPLYAQPIHAQPIHSQPIHSQPIHSQPIHSQSIYSQPIHAQPMNIQSIVSEQPSIPQDIEDDMYYTIKKKYPYDQLSIKQMDIFNVTFSMESNKEALIKLNPLVYYKLNPDIYGSFSQPIYYQQPYSSPIGPLSFLRSTIPYKPKKEDLDFFDLL